MGPYYGDLSCWKAPGRQSSVSSKPPSPPRVQRTRLVWTAIFVGPRFFFFAFCFLWTLRGDFGFMSSGVSFQHSKKRTISFGFSELQRIQVCCLVWLQAPRPQSGGRVGPARRPLRKLCFGPWPAGPEFPGGGRRHCLPGFLSTTLPPPYFSSFSHSRSAWSVIIAGTPLT